MLNPVVECVEPMRNTYRDHLLKEAFESNMVVSIQALAVAGHTRPPGSYPMENECPHPQN